MDSAVDGIYIMCLVHQACLYDIIFTFDSSVWMEKGHRLVMLANDSATGAFKSELKTWLVNNISYA